MCLWYNLCLWNCYNINFESLLNTSSVIYIFMNEWKYVREYLNNLIQHYVIKYVGPVNSFFCSVELFLRSNLYNLLSLQENPSWRKKTSSISCLNLSNPQRKTFNHFKFIYKFLLSNKPHDICRSNKDTCRC